MGADSLGSIRFADRAALLSVVKTSAAACSGGEWRQWTSFGVTMPMIGWIVTPVVPIRSGRARVRTGRFPRTCVERSPPE